MLGVPFVSLLSSLTMARPDTSLALRVIVCLTFVRHSFPEQDFLKRELQKRQEEQKKIAEAKLSAPAVAVYVRMRRAAPAANALLTVALRSCGRRVQFYDSVAFVNTRIPAVMCVRFGSHVLVHREKKRFVKRGDIEQLRVEKERAERLLKEQERKRKNGEGVTVAAEVASDAGVVLADLPVEEVIRRLRKLRKPITCVRGLRVCARHAP